MALAIETERQSHHSERKREFVLWRVDETGRVFPAEDFALPEWNRKFDLGPRQAIIARAMFAINLSRSEFVYEDVADAAVDVFQDKLPDKRADYVGWQKAKQKKTQDVNGACIAIADKLRKIDANAQNISPNMVSVLEYVKAQPEYQGLSNEELALVMEGKILFPELQQKMAMRQALAIPARVQEKKAFADNEQVRSLVARSVSGDQEAFGQLYTAYVDRIYRHIYYRVGSPENAEELTSQVFENAWKAFGRYRDMGRPFVTWLLAIANNQVIDFYREKKRHKNQEYLSDPTVAQAASLREGTVDPEDLVEMNFTSEELGRAILRLKPDHRAIVVMRFRDGIDFADIAAHLGKSEGAIRVILHRALSKLSRILGGGERKTARRSSSANWHTMGEVVVFTGRSVNSFSPAKREVIKEILGRHGAVFGRGGFSIAPEEYESALVEIIEKVGMVNLKRSESHRMVE